MLQTNLVNLNANRCFKIWEDNQEFIIVNISENENDIDEKLLNELHSTKKVRNVATDRDTERIK